MLKWKFHVEWKDSVGVLSAEDEEDAKAWARLTKPEVLSVTVTEVQSQEDS